jgi:hypothetical protein
MRFKPCLIVLTTLILSSLKGQAQSKDPAVVLQKLYDRILYTNIDTERLRLNDSVDLMIGSYVASDSVFKHRFANLRYLGQILSPDSRLKIVTWNLILRNGDNKYFSYIIRKGVKGKGNSIYKLTGFHKENQIRTDIPYSGEEWYGALYYAIQPYKKDYILLGIDFDNSLISRKIIEVLSFTPEGYIIFGKSCFINGTNAKFREVLEYSSEGIVSLRFNTGRLIVFDHLAPYSSGSVEISDSYGAGLSFDGYKYKKGLWIFTKNINIKNLKNRK